MATHSSVSAWRIPGTEEPGELLSMGSHRVGHDSSDLAAAAAISMCEIGLDFSALGEVSATSNDREGDGEQLVLAAA